MPLQFEIHPRATTDDAVRLFVSLEYLDTMQIQQITPDPETVYAAADRLIYVFPQLKPGEPSTIRFTLRSTSVGQITGQVGFEANLPLNLPSLFIPNGSEGLPEDRSNGCYCTRCNRVPLSAAGFSIIGKRALAQITTFDFVLLLIISEATQGALVGESFSVTNALLVIITMILLDMGLSAWKRRSPPIDKWIDGVPLILVDHGNLLKDRMDKVRIDEDDILTAARQLQGLNVSTRSNTPFWSEAVESRSFRSNNASKLSP